MQMNEIDLEKAFDGFDGWMESDALLAITN